MKEIILIMALILISVGLSGCTSSGVNPQTDIVNDGGSQIDGQWNDQYHTEWFFNGNVKSKTKTHYDPVILQFNAYDSSGALVGSQNVTIDMTKGFGYYQVVMKVTSAPTTINMTVINATKI